VWLNFDWRTSHLDSPVRGKGKRRVGREAKEKGKK